MLALGGKGGIWYRNGRDLARRSMAWLGYSGIYGRDIFRLEAALAEGGKGVSVMHAYNTECGHVIFISNALSPCYSIRCKHISNLPSSKGITAFRTVHCSPLGGTSKPTQ